MELRIINNIMFWINQISLKIIVLPHNYFTNDINLLRDTVIHGIVVILVTSLILHTEVLNRNTGV